MAYYLGIDVGSTTVKLYLTDENDQCLYSNYVRHFSDVRKTVHDLLIEVKEQLGDLDIHPAMTGSGGLSLAESLGMTFIQEVIACTKTVETYIPQTDVAIELGGEDAKITYFEASLEQRMNGTCAGGTGAFIDQMATLLQTDAAGLNELAKHHTTLYPIASRCGVFAKTDIQPLINEGVNKEDIAVSIFQAVVNQTISGLACGKPIRGNIAFLGGPLYFLDQLRQRFIETLKLTDEQVIFPDNSQLFVAMGACLNAKESNSEEVSLSTLIKRLETLKGKTSELTNVLEPLFKDEEELNEFRERHAQHVTLKRELSDYEGPVYLGIDVGSTTSKCVLTDPEGAILYTFYSSNQGSPLNLVIKMVKDIYEMLPANCYIAKSGVTGYGEALIKAAIKVDFGEVETIAHYTAAKAYEPDVDFILDIGGQDMKAISIRDNVIQNIALNEACSAGCGSFLETFAQSLGYNVEEFSQFALKSQHPIDLGSRCTVFMNSKVKQAQKEGASVEDISAGLSYSVIKNSLYKVIKLRSKEDIGTHVVVQGGTFYNEAVLRAFEKETGIEAIRPDIAGLMGAYGMAKIACENDENHQSSILTYDELQTLTFQNEMRNCGKCTNNCLLTITQFSDGREYISGNRCERGANLPLKSKTLPNLYDYKYRRIFGYRSLPIQDASRGIVGIPRVLNMYENYPFWHRFFTTLKFRVILSARSSKAIYEKGIESIPSESVCYPAKLVHGHIENLIDRQCRFIFYPSVAYERIEYKEAGNHYNCPVVASYPEVIRTNVDHLESEDINFKNPFISLNNPKTLFNVLKDSLAEFDISDDELHTAIDEAYKELEQSRIDIRNQGKFALDYMRENHKRGIVLAGRPYHVDPEINHGIADLITGEGFCVLTEDSVCWMNEEETHLRVVDQWTYHSRLYRAAEFVTTQPDLDLVQLTSFGCGLDAVTADQVAELLQARDKIYTLIKIDEVSNLGPIRIRIRSLKATIKKKDNTVHLESKYEPVVAPFTKQMKKEQWTILCPQMSPIHFQFVELALREEGYNFVVLPSVDKGAIEAGLKYVNNDACYPSILVIGQMMEALNSGQYDINHTALIITQTGGGCRATNYIAFIRKALKDAHMEQVPVISANLAGLETNPGFKITYSLAKRVVIGALYGDLFMRVLYRVRPYELVPGSANELYESWVEKCKKNVISGSMKEFKRNVYAIVSDFDHLPLRDIKKPRVGLVGEILVKFHPTANNEIVKIIEEEGAEAVMPDLLDFFQYSFYNQQYAYRHYDASWKQMQLGNAAIKFIDFLRKDMIKALKASERFTAPHPIDQIAAKASEVVSIGNRAGEGWFLTGEMIELIDEGASNIVCMQPFACLPNHVTGKGVIKALRKKYPQSNIVAIDYDPGASETNQLNRIKLMLSTAFKNMEKEELLHNQESHVAQATL
ncbi:MAG: 2-hydroxyacyl-CoA dehydratase [Erysipelotrichaceae bacterium]|nr:2-hydroxyacyl-CoA dehydratase [Erysipelotrichaceae bacterium]